MNLQSNNNRWKKIAIGLSVVVLFVSLAPAFAQTGSREQSEAFKQSAGFSEQTQDPRAMVAFIIRGIVSVLGIVMVGYMIWGGYLIMTAAGVQDRIDRGRRSIWTSVVGAAILLSAFAISQFVLYVVDRSANPPDPTFGPPSGPYVDIDVQPDANVPQDPLFDTDHRDPVNWGDPETWER